MLGQRFLPTSYQAKLQQMDYDRHVKRLEQISKGSKSMYEEREDNFRSTLGDLKTKSHKFQTSEKLISIDKTNQNLLDKLVKISNSQKPPLFKSTVWSGHPGTLNTTFRKQQLEKIALENEAMAKRLISQQGSVNKKQLKKDFEKHLDYSKNVQKVSSPKIDKLLPIRSPKAVGDSKGFKVSRKKNHKQNSVSLQVKAVKSDEVELKDHFASPLDANQENEADQVRKMNRSASETVNIPDDNDTTVVSKELENDRKEGMESVPPGSVEGEAVVEPQQDTQVQPDTEKPAEVAPKEEEEAVKAQPEAEGEAESKTEKQAEVQLEAEAEPKSEKQAETNAEEPNQENLKPQEAGSGKSGDIEENKNQLPSQRGKESEAAVTVPEKMRTSTRKDSSAVVKNQKAKGSTEELGQIATSRSNNELAKSQLSSSQVENKSLKKSQLSKSQVERPQLDKSAVKSTRKESKSNTLIQSQRINQSPVPKEQLEAVQDQPENKSEIISERKSVQNPKPVDNQEPEKEKKPEVEEEQEADKADEKPEVVQEKEEKVEENVEEKQQEEKSQEVEEKQVATE